MSQASLNVPTIGPSPPTTFAGIINGAMDAVVTKNSGATAPANFPTTSGGAATAFQDWADTSPGSGLIDEKEFDGSTWLNKGAMDQTNHVWMPKVGGGSGTIAAAATTDIGSVRQSYVLITGSSLSTAITSFGNNALLNTGETRFLKFAASGIITYNATTMILPGSADLSFNAGDTLQAVYLSAGNWLCFNYRSNISTIGRNTGDLFEKWGTGSIGGSVRLNGGTMGNGASGGTERANADTSNLFIFLYINDTALTVSGGRTAPGTTRANAITDFNLNKTITLPTVFPGAARPTRQIITATGAGTYITPAGCSLIIARYVAGGGGGAAQTTNSGSTGGTTTFNGVDATGGGGGQQTNAQGGIGGTGGAGAATLRGQGSSGANGQNGADFNVCGSNGAPGWNGLGAGRGSSGNGGVGASNTGAGGAGGAGNNTAAGGGAGESVELQIPNPASSYSYTVGDGGNGGAAGGNGGGKGGSGILIVDEYYSGVNSTKYVAL